MLKKSNSLRKIFSRTKGKKKLKENESPQQKADSHSFQEIIRTQNVDTKKEHFNRKANEIRDELETSLREQLEGMQQRETAATLHLNEKITAITKQRDEMKNKLQLTERKYKHLKKMFGEASGNSGEAFPKSKEVHGFEGCLRNQEIQTAQRIQGPDMKAKISSDELSSASSSEAQAKKDREVGGYVRNGGNLVIRHDRTKDKTDRCNKGEDMDKGSLHGCIKHTNLTVHDIHRCLNEIKSEIFGMSTKFEKFLKIHSGEEIESLSETKQNTKKKHANEAQAQVQEQREQQEQQQQQQENQIIQQEQVKEEKKEQPEQQQQQKQQQQQQQQKLQLEKQQQPQKQQHQQPPVEQEQQQHQQTLNLEPIQVDCFKIRANELENSENEKTRDVQICKNFQDSIQPITKNVPPTQEPIKKLTNSCTNAQECERIDDQKTNFSVSEEIGQTLVGIKPHEGESSHFGAKNFQLFSKDPDTKIQDLCAVDTVDDKNITEHNEEDLGVYQMTYNLAKQLDYTLNQFLGCLDSLRGSSVQKDQCKKAGDSERMRTKPTYEHIVFHGDTKGCADTSQGYGSHCLGQEPKLASVNEIPESNGSMASMEAQQSSTVHEQSTFLNDCKCSCHLNCNHNLDVGMSSGYISEDASASSRCMVNPRWDITHVQYRTQMCRRFGEWGLTGNDYVQRHIVTSSPIIATFRDLKPGEV